MFVIKKYLKNNKGLSSIETAIISLVLLTCITGLIDLTKILNKFNAISTTATYVGRTVAKQGGVRTSKPENFKGDYVNSNELYADVRDSLNKAGISTDEFTLKVNGYTVNGATNVPLVNHKNNIAVELSVDYGWSLFPGMTYNKKAVRNVTSTYKIRN